MEKISTHIAREWLSDDRIVAYRVAALDAQGLHDWSKDIVTTLSHWKTNRFLMLYDLATGVSVPLLVLTNFNILDPGLTKIGQGKVEELLIQKPKTSIHLALVLPTTISGRLTTTRARSSSKLDSSRIKSQIFVDRTVALRWLDGLFRQDSAHK